MKENELPTFKSFYTSAQKENRDKLLALFKQSAIPDEEKLSNLGLFIKRQDLMKILFINELYQMIVPVHGCVMEFGVRWGQNLALFETFRGIYEPYNHNRRFIGFDTFEGFASIHDKDGASDVIYEGAFNVTQGYEEYLEKVLDCHENESPISHIKKYRLVKGDAVATIGQYLEENPATIVAFAYFDFDIYAPTKKCLEAIRPHLTKGTVIGFDEINAHYFPGETLALKEVLGLDRYEIRRSKYSSLQSYLVVK